MVFDADPDGVLAFCIRFFEKNVGLSFSISTGILLSSADIPNVSFSPEKKTINVVGYVGYWLFSTNFFSQRCRETSSGLLTDVPLNVMDASKRKKDLIVLSCLSQ